MIFSINDSNTEHLQLYRTGSLYLLIVDIDRRIGQWSVIASWPRSVSRSTYGRIDVHWRRVTVILPYHFSSPLTDSTTTTTISSSSSPVIRRDSSNHRSVQSSFCQLTSADIFSRRTTEIKSIAIKSTFMNFVDKAVTRNVFREMLSLIPSFHFLFISPNSKWPLKSK